jgi:hypothetical protein
MERYAYMFIVASFIFNVTGELPHAQTHRSRSSGHPVLPGKGCEYKSLYVPTENGESKQLSQSYDLRQIATAMRLNSDYEVNDRASGGIGLILSRTFNGVKYNIFFDVHGGVYEFSLNTYNFDGYPNGSVSGGEKCTTPNYVMKRKVYRMIDDLPLQPQQKAELKQYVRVRPIINARLF